MAGRLEPLSYDRTEALRLGMAAVRSRVGEGRESEAWLQRYGERFEAGTVPGQLYVVGGTATGFVSWSPGGPHGVSIELIYAVPGASWPGEYAQILAAVVLAAGPVAFVSGPLAGLVPAEEERLMRSLGFEPFGRSEMVLEGDRSPDVPPLRGGEAARPADRSDLSSLADLHRRAYLESFDRYLFLESADEAEDAEREIRQILDGRWGEFYPVGSWVAERNGSLVGAVLTVHGTTGALIADVMVAPEHRGGGLGRHLLATAVRSMHQAGDRRIYLNVTEGNAPALRLYRGLGFARSLGPTRDWYNAARIPVAPGPSV